MGKLFSSRRGKGKQRRNRRSSREEALLVCLRRKKGVKREDDFLAKEKKEGERVLTRFFSTLLRRLDSGKGKEGGKKQSQ